MTSETETGDVPREFEAALIKDGAAKNAFDQLTDDQRREIVGPIASAADAEARGRAISDALEHLRERSKD